MHQTPAVLHIKLWAVEVIRTGFVQETVQPVNVKVAQYYHLVVQICIVYSYCQAIHSSAVVAFHLTIRNTCPEYYI